MISATQCMSGVLTAAGVAAASWTERPCWRMLTWHLAPHSCTDRIKRLAFLAIWVNPVDSILLLIGGLAFWHACSAVPRPPSDNRGMHTIGRMLDNSVGADGLDDLSAFSS